MIAAAVRMGMMCVGIIGEGRRAHCIRGIPGSAPTATAARLRRCCRRRMGSAHLHRQEGGRAPRYRVRVLNPVPLDVNVAITLFVCRPSSTVDSNANCAPWGLDSKPGGSMDVK
ncbi:hypothetical protein TNCV_5117461 [Trichonephila clavipes]|nr:hypothetical protein TNCV_5117461 [Trichonephila clavipes]